MQREKVASVGAAVVSDSRDLTLTGPLPPHWPLHGVHLSPDLIVISALIPRLFDRLPLYGPGVDEPGPFLTFLCGILSFVIFGL